MSDATLAAGTELSPLAYTTTRISSGEPLTQLSFLVPNAAAQSGQVIIGVKDGSRRSDGILTRFEVSFIVNEPRMTNLSPLASTSICGGEFITAEFDSAASWDAGAAGQYLSNLKLSISSAADGWSIDVPASSLTHETSGLTLAEFALPAVTTAGEARMQIKYNDMLGSFQFEAKPVVLQKVVVGAQEPIKKRDITEGAIVKYSHSEQIQVVVSGLELTFENGKSVDSSLKMVSSDAAGFSGKLEHTADGHSNYH